MLSNPIVSPPNRKPFDSQKNSLNCFEVELFSSFFGPHLRHMEVPRLGVESEPQLQAYTTAMWDPNHIFDLCHSLWQHQILKAMRQGSNQCLDGHYVGFLTLWATTGTPKQNFWMQEVDVKYLRDSGYGLEIQDWSPSLFLMSWGYQAPGTKSSQLKLMAVTTAGHMGMCCQWQKLQH